MSKFELAQLNVAVMKEPLESPSMTEFVANVDRINAVAEASRGFVWRLSDATALRPLGDNVLVNMSIWCDVASLTAYVYKSAHVEIMRRRREWFMHTSEAYVVLWWVPRGHRPLVAEAIEHLNHLREHGPSPTAFTFIKAFQAPDAIEPNSQFTFTAGCQAT